MLFPHGFLTDFGFIMGGLGTGFGRLGGILGRPKTALNWIFDQFVILNGFGKGFGKVRGSFSKGLGKGSKRF